MHAYIICTHFGFKSFLGSTACIGSRAAIGSSRRSLMCHSRHRDRLSIVVVVIYVSTVRLAMSKRKSIGEDDGGRKHLRAQLCATTTSSKTAMANTLHNRALARLKWANKRTNEQTTEGSNKRTSERTQTFSPTLDARTLAD